MKRYLVLAALLCGTAQAQVWNTNSMQWDAPTTCTTGEPISACPVTGYQIERSATATGAYARVFEVGANTTNFNHENALAGGNCYRIIATSGRGPSPVSVPPLCFTNTPPVGPPNPPTNLRRVVQVQAGINFAPMYRVLGSRGSYRQGEFYGLIPVGSKCGTEEVFKYRGASFHWVEPKSAWYTSNLRDLAAPCA